MASKTHYFASIALRVKDNKTLRENARKMDVGISRLVRIGLNKVFAEANLPLLAEDYREQKTDRRLLASADEAEPKETT